MSSHTRKRTAEYPDLLAWRTARKLTLKEAADYLELPLTSYYYYERGTRRPQRLDLPRILAKTRVSLEFLAGAA